MSEPWVLFDTPALEVIWWPRAEWRWRTTVPKLPGVSQFTLLWLEVRTFSRSARERIRQEIERQKRR